jgi:ParB-like nuclease domain
MKKSRAVRSLRRGQKLTAPDNHRPLSAAIENVPINDLRRYQNNPRLHPKSQIDKLARAIDEFGFLIPVLIDSQNKVLAGHARLEAADKLSLPSVPCIRASHLTEAQKRTFIITDNRLTEEAKWDFQLLAKEIEFLQDEGIDLTTTGFEIPEIEMIFDALMPNASNPATLTTCFQTLPQVTLSPDPAICGFLVMSLCPPSCLASIRLSASFASVIRMIWLLSTPTIFGRL